MGPFRKSCSPPTLAAPNPAPWNESQNESVLCRPVAARASLSATSTASEPPVVMSTRSSPAGASASSSSAHSTLMPLVYPRGTNRTGARCSAGGEGEKFLGLLEGDATRIPTRHKRQRCKLLGERGPQPRVSIADLVRRVAVKIKITGAVHSDA